MNDPMRLGRRDLGQLAGMLLGAAGLPAKAGAQPAGAAARNVVLALPMPCADRPGDLVGLLLEGQGSPANTITVFGQAFPAGAVPRGARLVARLADGRALPAQLDPTTRHPDGSVRFGVVSLAAPALALGARAGVVLALAEGAAPAALDLATALAGRQAVLEVTPTGGGTPWRADLLVLARAGAVSPWQSGPLATQLRLAVPVPATALGGITSMRLVADIAVRADGTLWVDAWLRNDAAMRPGGGDAAYGMRLLLDGREALAAPRLRQFQYTGWGRLLGAAPGGKPAPTPPLVRPDVAYLARSGAVPRYDLSMGIDQTLLADLAKLMAAPDWNAPLGNRGITQYMPMTGGRADIGQMTRWQAAWLTSGDARAAAFSLGQAEAAGGVPWHFWDPGGGADGRGGWMDVQRWPGFWVDGRNGLPPRSLLQQPTDSGWAPDTAHQPDLSYVPYLLTGRRAFLDHLQAQAAMNVVSTWPAVRGSSDMGITERNQVRGAAWGIRQLDEAGWVSPDTDSNTAYLRRAAAANWRWLVERIPEWTVRQGEAHGWVDPVDYGPFANGIAVWQQDFFASTVIASASRGNADALAYLTWAANFLLGRFQQEARGFAFRDGAAYVMLVFDAANNRMLRSWSEIGAAMVARDQSNRNGWAHVGEIHGALATVAGIEALIEPLAAEARRVHARLLEAAGPLASVESYARYPGWNIMPRGQARLAGQAPRCAK